MQRPLNRLEPLMPPASYKTYQVAAPLATHYRDASCAEVDCAAHRHGWQTTVDETTELGRRQAYHVRRMAGRRYTEERDDAGLTVFTFEPGQRCFAAPHKQPLDRPALYLVGPGDHRMYDPRAAARLRPDQWVGDFHEHQQRLADRLNQG